MDLSTGAVFSHALCMDLSTGAVFSHEDGPDFRIIDDEMCINTCVYSIRTLVSSRITEESSMQCA